MNLNKTVERLGVSILPYQKYNNKKQNGDIMRIEKAKKILFAETGAERILDTSTCCDYVQFVTTQGGDVSIYRVYDNGEIVEK